MRTRTAGRGSLAILSVMAAAALVSTATISLAQRPATQANPLDKSDLGRSKQDPNLKGHPVPPTVTAKDKLPLDRIKVPPGFKVEAWAHGMPGARTIIRGPKGTYFVSTRAIGRVYAVQDKGDKREVKIIIQGLNLPNGLAMLDGALHVFAVNKVLRYDNIEDRLDNIPQPVDISDKLQLPGDAQHGWKYVAWGPDGKLYVPVGANCNICEVNPGTHGHIRRYDPADWKHDIVARGVRNTVGFDWHPVTKELWFTDNGRDWAGDNGPQDELNRVTKANEGASFGFPYCHAQGMLDPDIRVPNACASSVRPAALVGPHAAALGMKFYTGAMFPAAYHNAAFIARHGSWNRTRKLGYDVVTARILPNGRVKVEPFLTGLLDEKENAFYGRPADVFLMPDGSMLVSDEYNGAFYRVSYDATRQAGR